MSAPATRPAILLVDDDTAAALLARIALEESGLNVQVESASGIQDATRILWQGANQSGALPDLVLLDLNLRDGSGHDLLSFIKSEQRLKALPVVILSTSSHPGDIRRAVEGGAARYIVKPEEFDVFVDAMRGLGDLLPAHSR